MHTIIAWTIAGFCIALLICFIGASIAAAALSAGNPQTLREAKVATAAGDTP
jgi:hypothetical protein